MVVVKVRFLFWIASNQSFCNNFFATHPGFRCWTNLSTDWTMLKPDFCSTSSPLGWNASASQSCLWIIYFINIQQYTISNACICVQDIFNIIWSYWYWTVVFKFCAAVKLPIHEEMCPGRTCNTNGWWLVGYHIDHDPSKVGFICSIAATHQGIIWWSQRRIRGQHQKGHGWEQEWE